jgi:hypothetical protein
VSPMSLSRLWRSRGQSSRGRFDVPTDNIGPRRYEANPADADALGGFRFFAIVKTWMDEDIVEAIVRNATAQGVEATFVVDNGSTDATVLRAQEAGATVAEVFDTPAFDGPLAQTLMNAVVARESLRSGAEHVWWLYLDSDEFPEGPSGLSLREYLATLDRRFRVVGSACVNHLPTAKPEFIPGFHPIDFQPNCYEFEPRWTPICGQRHWKHPLQRIDRGAHFIVNRAGAHWGICPDELIEPEGGIVTHHFQYRDEALTRAKLDLTCGPGSRRTALYGGSGQDGFNRRLRSLDAVYAQAWDDVEIEAGTTLAATDGPRPWPALTSVRRWYSTTDLEAARGDRVDG